MEEFLVPYASSSTPKFFVGANSDVTVVHDDNTIVVHRSNKLNSYDTNNDVFNFPPGFRFCPLDEELIRCYLKKKVLNQALPPNKIHEVNLYKFTPWELSVMFATVGEKEWYFFTPRDRKYKNGLRPNRAAGGGFWKATGADKSIRNKHKVVVGYRKALVFYEGKPPKGVKTNWIMHEYRVEGAPSPKPRGDGGDANDMRLDNWVLCRIYQKYGKSEKKFAPKNQSVPKLAAPPQAVVSPPPLPPQPTESSVVLYGEAAVAQLSFLSEQDDMDEMQAFYYSPMEYDVIANQPYLPPGLESLLIAENDNGAIQEYME